MVLHFKKSCDKPTDYGPSTESIELKIKQAATIFIINSISIVCIYINKTAIKFFM